MKKIYYHPQIKICKMMAEPILGTDSNGEWRGSDSRRANVFTDDEGEEENAKSVWFSD